MHLQSDQHGFLFWTKNSSSHVILIFELKIVVSKVPKKIERDMYNY